MNGDGRHARAEAEAWVMSNEARSPFAFEVICEELGLAPGAVRKALAESRPRGQRGLRTRPTGGRRHQVQLIRKRNRRKRYRDGGAPFSVAPAS